MKGHLYRKKQPQGWYVAYEFGELGFHKTELPLHPYDVEFMPFRGQLPNDQHVMDGMEVEFEIEDFWETGLEEVIKVARLPLPKLMNRDGTPIRTYSSPKIKELLDEIELENKYTDSLQQVSDEIDANIVKMMVKASRETMINYTKWLAQEEWMSVWVGDKWMWESQKEKSGYNYMTEEGLYDLYLKNLEN